MAPRYKFDKTAPWLAYCITDWGAWNICADTWEELMQYARVIWCPGHRVTVVHPRRNQ